MQLVTVGFHLPRPTGAALNDGEGTALFPSPRFRSGDQAFGDVLEATCCNEAVDGPRTAGVGLDLGDDGGFRGEPEKRRAVEQLMVEPLQRIEALVDGFGKQGSEVTVSLQRAQRLPTGVTSNCILPSRTKAGEDELAMRAEMTRPEKRRSSLDWFWSRMYGPAVLAVPCG